MLPPGRPVTCQRPRCGARVIFQGEAGWHDLRVRYFDQNNGAAHYRVLLNGNLLEEWSAADNLPTQKIDSASSSLRTISGVALQPGDEIRIEGSPGGGETAALDYIEIT